MARFGPRRAMRFLPRVRSNKTRRTRWTAQIIDRQDTITASQTATILAGPADYATNTNLEPGEVTCLRIRAVLTFVPTVTTAGTCFWMIGRNDQTTVATQMDPSNFQSLIDEDVMIWGHFSYGAAALSTERQQARYQEIIDIRVKRLLKQQDILFSTRCTGTAGIQGFVTLTCRTLLVGEMT